MGYFTNSFGIVSSNWIIRLHSYEILEWSINDVLLSCTSHSKLIDFCWLKMFSSHTTLTGSIFPLGLGEMTKISIQSWHDNDNHSSTQEQWSNDHYINSNASEMRHEEKERKNLPPKGKNLEIATEKSCVDRQKSSNFKYVVVLVISIGICNCSGPQKDRCFRPTLVSQSTFESERHSYSCGGLTCCGPGQNLLNCLTSLYP